MATASFQYFNSFVEELAEAKHDLSTGPFKIVLTNTAPVAANTTLANITQIASGNGYTTDGNSCSITSSSQTSGTYKLVLGSPATWTATPSAMATFQYAVLYNDGHASNGLVGFWAYPSAVTLGAGETFTVTLSGANGVLTLAPV